MCTSIELLKARLTLASMCTTFPNLIGFSKEMLSTEAVTTGALQCFPAESAAAISIQYMSRPPIRLPNTLVSLGSTSSVITISDSLAVFALGVILSNLCANIEVKAELVGMGWFGNAGGLGGR